VASSTLPPRAQRDARLLQPGADGPAAHPQPLANLGRGQPLLLVEPAQLRPRTASRQATSRWDRCQYPHGRTAERSG
jgi:hypothetical protein